MKKVKQSKKRWAWTEAQKRKHWTQNHWTYDSPPKWCCDKFDNANNTIVKKALKDIKFGMEPDDVEFGEKFVNNSAKWYWW